MTRYCMWISRINHLINSSFKIVNRSFSKFDSFDVYRLLIIKNLKIKVRSLLFMNFLLLKKFSLKIRHNKFFKFLFVCQSSWRHYFWSILLILIFDFNSLRFKLRIIHIGSQRGRSIFSSWVSRINTICRLSFLLLINFLILLHSHSIMHIYRFWINIQKLIFNLLNFVSVTRFHLFKFFDWDSI